MPQLALDNSDPVMNKQTVNEYCLTEGLATDGC